ncbi:hypothetical protein [Chroococcidiopsis sp.]|uniref:hypothetical protein n=1 Tax=Chroococcidiopsis sp. TaxID=3088168 RepID=UPI003F3F71BF
MTHQNFKSAFLGAVCHPKNVLREYLAAFKNKCQADILSFIDGWIKTNRSKQRPDWVRLSASYLADSLGYCKKTIATHLKKLVEMGVLVRDTLIKLFACDTAYSYKIDEAVLLDKVGNFDCASEVNLPLQQSKVTTLEEKKDPAYYIDLNKEINSNNAENVVASLQTNNIEVQPRYPENNQSIISEEKIKQVETLGVDKIFPALAAEIEKAEPEVFDNAIAVVKKAVAKGKVSNIAAYLMDALKKRFEPSKSEKVLDRNAQFTLWRKASPANSVAARFSRSDRGCIEISADGDTWVEWQDR